LRLSGRDKVRPRTRSSTGARARAIGTQGASLQRRGAAWARATAARSGRGAAGRAVEAAAAASPPGLDARTRNGPLWRAVFALAGSRLCRRRGRWDADAAAFCCGLVAGRRRALSRWARTRGRGRGGFRRGARKPLSILPATSALRPLLARAPAAAAYHRAPFRAARPPHAELVAQA
jgi:hypothetical protein